MGTLGFDLLVVMSLAGNMVVMEVSAMRIMETRTLHDIAAASAAYFDCHYEYSYSYSH